MINKAESSVFQFPTEHSANVWRMSLRARYDRLYDERDKLEKGMISNAVRLANLRRAFAEHDIPWPQDFEK